MKNLLSIIGGVFGALAWYYGVNDWFTSAIAISTPTHPFVKTVCSLVFGVTCFGALSLVLPSRRRA